MYIKFYHQANNRGKYADAFYNSVIDDKDGHIPSPLIMFTCTTLHHALVEWQKNKCVHPKASKSKLKADRPDHLNYFNYNVTGVFSPNNQYNIYWSKHSCLSKYLFLSSSYPKSQLLVPQQRELPI